MAGPPAVTPGDTVEHAARLMYQRRVKHLPVVDAGYHLAGIISRADVLSVRWLLCAGLGKPGLVARDFGKAADCRGLRVCPRGLPGRRDGGDGAMGVAQDRLLQREGQRVLAAAGVTNADGYEPVRQRPAHRG